MVYKKRKRKVQFGFKLMAFLFLGMFFLLIFAYKNPIILRSTNPIIQLHEKYDPKENIQKVFFHSNQKVEVIGKVDTNKTANYSITYQLGSYKKKCVISVKDTKAPILKVKSITTDLVHKVTPQDFVSKVKDDTKVTLSFEKKSTNQQNQNVTIIAKDAYGNTTKKQTTLTRKKDTQKPKIIKLHNLKIYADQKHNFSKDFKITDNYDLNPKVKIDSSSVDLNQPGTYNLYISASDRSGNTIKKTFKVHVEEAKKTVYLTFDDGPSENTEKVLKILKKNKIHATFFVTGSNQKYNASIKKAYDQGNTIALHSYTHNYATIYASTQAYFDDLNQLNDMVYSIIGKRVKFIRFPGGSSNMISANYSKGIMTQLVDMVHQQGYEYFDWNCSSGDAASNTVDKNVIIQNATNCDYDSIMILFHDSSPKKTTVQALQKVIDYYKSKGYVFKKITKDTPAIHHGENN